MLQLKDAYTTDSVQHCSNNTLLSNIIVFNSQTLEIKSVCNIQYTCNIIAELKSKASNCGARVTVSLYSGLQNGSLGHH